MLELLREHEVAERFCERKKPAAECLIAVPFWGKGAHAQFDLGNGQKSRIICNLKSSACNPYAIEDLKKSHGVTVRSHPRLHAKIYATTQFVIIGSSNASTNGLAIAGAFESWIEANVISDDSNLVTRVLALFEDVWKNRETTEVTEPDLTEAKKIWDNRVKPDVTATSLLAACREHPELFESVYLAAYQYDLGENGQRAMEDFINNPPGHELAKLDESKIWGYQFKNMPEGARLIDLDCRNRNKVFGGYAQVTTPIIRLSAGNENIVTIAVEQDSIKMDNMNGPLRSFKLLASEEREILKKN